MSDKPPLLWHSNAPWTGTGYGTQTALFTRPLAESYDMAISAYWGLEGAVIPWNGIPVLPGIGNTFGNQTIAEHARSFFGDRKGLVLTLMDAWVLEPSAWTPFDVVCWAPVDHDPCPRPVADFFHHSGAIPMAMSKFGREKFIQAGLDPLYVPHAVDTSIYRPLDRTESRTALGLPEEPFIVGMVAANKGNPSRKCFIEAFQAFKLLLDKHPEAILYLHTEATGRFDGVNLPQALHDCSVPRESVVYCDQYRAAHFPFTDEQMARAFSSLDVLLSPSAGEGFGVSVIQAQACGVPVIASDFSAQPELVGAGWLVEGTRHYTPIGSWQIAPDVPDIHQALQRAYSMSPAARDEAREKALVKAANYDIDRVMEDYMLPALVEARSRFADREPVAA